MSNVAVIITSEQCGHCRNMRGTGRLLSKNEIKRDNRQPNIQGGNHYDAAFMKKLITAELGTAPRLRVINIHYKSFNTAEGVIDISIFTLDNDGNTIKQTMLREKEGKSQLTLYSIGETGKVEITKDIDTPWNELVKEYTPVNIRNYIFFFPSIVLFEGKAWSEGIKNKTPIYGYLNGFETKNEAPYGATPGPNPNVIEMSKFLKQFFDGSKTLSGSPPTAPQSSESRKLEPIPEEPVVEKPAAPETVKVLTTKGVSTQEYKESLVKVGLPTPNRFKFKLYVVE